jgi:hypothetical protein
MVVPESINSKIGANSKAAMRSAVKNKVKKTAQSVPAAEVNAYNASAKDTAAYEKGGLKSSLQNLVQKNWRTGKK